MPVPTPATALLLAGKPTYARGPETELTTPTGAALLAALAGGFGPLPSLRIKAQGFGAGTKDFPQMANVVRVLLGEPTGASEATQITVIEANIDDATPQVLGYAVERLLDAGALDVTLSPVFMKKQRAAVTVEILARPEDRERLAEILFAETPTLGVRFPTAERLVRARSTVEVETGFGKVRMKVADGTTATPEYDDCRALAASSGKPLREVLAAAVSAWEKNRT
jgi:uncharacterized protein (DUF111 family)